MIYFKGMRACTITKRYYTYIPAYLICKQFSIHLRYSTPKLFPNFAFLQAFPFPYKPATHKLSLSAHKELRNTVRIFWEDKLSTNGIKNSFYSVPSRKKVPTMRRKRANDDDSYVSGVEANRWTFLLIQDTGCLTGGFAVNILIETNVRTNMRLI